MAIRSILAVGLFSLAAAGCAGMSGQRFYDEQGKSGRGLSEIVDCPTCPSHQGSRNAIVHAAPGGAHDDGVIPPHAKFHPVPTRPVFAPKVMPAAATVAVAQAPAAPTLAVAEVDNSDEAPAPPAALTAAKPTSRSVLKRSAPKLLAEDATATPLLAAKTPTLATFEQTAAPASPTPAAPKATSDGWRPRVAN